MNKIIWKKTIVSVIALIAVAFPVVAQNDLNDSILKLSSIHDDSLYLSSTTSITESYLKRKLNSEGLNFLATQLKQKSTDHAKVQHLQFLYCKLHYHSKDYETCLSVTDSFIKNNKNLSDETKGKMFRIKGQCNFKSYQFGDAIDNFKQGLACFKRSDTKDQIDDVLAAISTSYSELDNLTEALRYGLEAEKISEETNDLKSRSRILNTLGNIYKSLNKWNEAKIYYLKCTDIAKNMGDKEGLVLSTSSLGLLELNKAYYVQSEKYFKKALDYAIEYNFRHLVTGVKSNLGNLMMEQRRYDEALDYYNQSLEESLNLNDVRNVALVKANLGFLYSDKKNYSKSNELLKDALPLAEEQQDIELIREIHGGLFDNYKALNISDKALYHHEMLMLFSDSILNDEKATQIANLKMQYAVDVKERELNAIAENDKAIADTEIKRQKLLRNFSIGGVILLFLFALFVFQRYRERHKTSLLLTQKNRQIEKAYNELKETQEELVQTEKQREAQSIRVRIARDIHDDIGSGLTKITMLSDVLKKKAAQPEFAESLSKITSYSKGVSASLGEIVWAINPANDSVNSLVTYMKAAAHNLLDDSGVNYSLNFPKEEIKTVVHPEIKRNIYLVMKEAINNSLKYSMAKNINVTFEINNYEFELEVIDDGIGFNLDINSHSHIKGEGNGLRNMEQRMRQYGTFGITSTLGSGCKIVAKGKFT